MDQENRLQGVVEGRTVKEHGERYGEALLMAARAVSDTLMLLSCVDTSGFDLSEVHEMLHKVLQNPEVML